MSAKRCLTAACVAILVLGYSCNAVTSSISRTIGNRRRASVRNDAVWSIGCLRELWFDQRVDHFSAGARAQLFAQRYFTCEKFWAQRPGGGRGPIFFYAGNEADVTLYVNATGIVWEHAEEFGALVVFAEHRYYGRSQPFGADSWRKQPAFLTVEQALADYAQLLWDLTRQLRAEDSPVIAFGGSYGGMLAAWLRMKYPHLVAGAIAASAPVGAFPGVPGWQPSRFWEVVTYDATAAAGSTPECAANVRAAFVSLMALGRTAVGRQTLGRLLRLCKPIADEEDTLVVAFWLQGAFDAFAMGNYPYPSSYISDDPAHPLPAWPMRAACVHMAGNQLRATDLVEALRDAVGVLYNVTGRLECFEVKTSGPAAGNQGPWDYQWCSQFMAQELPYYPATGTSDMFWDQGPFDLEGINQHCLDTWGVKPDADWSAMTYGGLDYRYGSNIVFSNGLYDPWSAFGVLANQTDSVIAVIIPEGAHHLDLMYSNPADPPSVKDARRVEMSMVRQWVDEHAARTASRCQQQRDPGCAGGTVKGYGDGPSSDAGGSVSLERRWSGAESSSITA